MTKTITTVHLFVCFVFDTICRDCRFASVTSLWEVMVASEPQRALLFEQYCQLHDVLVNIYVKLFDYVLIRFLDCVLRRICIYAQCKLIN